MKHQFYFIRLVGVLLLISCEKEIDVDLNSSDPYLIIEGNITDDLGPYEVRLSRSLNFSDIESYPSVESALVILTEINGAIDTLVHVGNGRYRTSFLQGHPGRTYKLEVLSEGSYYYAFSSMPTKVIVDSLRFEEVEGLGFSSGINYLTVPVYTDPVFMGNSYRYILSVNGERDNSYIVSNDNISNGEVNDRPVRSFDIDISSGDEVELEMRCISTEIYDYFFTLSQIEGNGPGGGVTPSNPPTNLVGENCLGYFSAHTVQKLIKTAQ
jgi:hypothetical protein